MNELTLLLRLLPDLLNILLSSFPIFEIFTFTASSPLKASRRERKISLEVYCLSIPILYRPTREKNEDKVYLSTHMHTHT